MKLSHLQLFAAVLDKIRNTPDGDGSLLDHTIMMYGAGMGDGNEHYPHHPPTILVGGGCEKLQGGPHIAANVETPFMNPSGQCFLTLHASRLP